MVKHPEHPDAEALAAEPCPWCYGPTKIRVLKIRERTPDFGRTWIYCAKCQASGPTADNEAAAVAAWNERSGPKIAGARR